MHITKRYEFPKHLQSEYNKAKIYEWISIAYYISLITVLMLTMGSSQSMKTVWFDSILSLIPPISFLITSYLITKPASQNFPYGLHKSTGIAYLISSLALSSVGLILLVDGLHTLFTVVELKIGNITILNHTFWFGYLMIAALLWQIIPSLILGTLKIGLAKKIFDKILYTDGKMNKADWLSGCASIIGIIGIGYGFWWMDALAGIIISIDIMYDGFKNLKQSILDLMDEIPFTLTGDKKEPLIREVKSILKQNSWIKDAEVRFRDEGHVFFGDIFIIPQSNTKLVENIETLRKEIEDLDWRMHDIVITPKAKR